MHGEAVECDGLTVDDEHGAVGVNSAADVRVRRLVDRRRLL